MRSGEPLQPGPGRDLALSQALARATRLHGDATAIVDGERRVTWSEFGDRAARLACALRALGMADGDRVAILSDNSHRYLEIYFGVPWGGGIFTPLNFRLAVPELVAILDDAEGLPSAADVLSTAQQDAIRTRADEQGSADPWVSFPQGSAVASYVGNRLLPVMIPSVLMKAGIPDLARRGQTTNVSRFTASDGSTVYTFTQRMGATLNGRPAKTIRAAYSIGQDGSLVDLGLWLDKTYLGGAIFENAEPFTAPTGAVPAASLGFPGT